MKKKFYGNQFSTKKWRSFSDAKKFVHKLKLTGRDSWDKYARSNKKPGDIPAAPWFIYKDKGWNGMGDWVGTGRLANQNKKKRSFEDAKKFVHKQKISGLKKWQEYCTSGKKPDDIPSNARTFYEKQGKWTSWGDFLGTGNVQAGSIKYRSFKDAREFTQKLKLNGKEEWYKFARSNKKPENIPNDPRQHYIRKKEWTSWPDFLGTGNISNLVKAKNWLPIKEAKIEARKLVKELGIKTKKDWENAHKAGKIPQNLPRYLHDIYGPNSKQNKKND